MDADEIPLSWVLYILGSLVFYLFMKDRGYIQIDHGLFWPGFIGFCIVTGQTIIWWSRYKMPKVAVNGFNGSIWGKPHPVLDDDGVVWAIFNTGEFLEPVRGKGKLATLIVPWYKKKEDGSKIFYLKQAGKNYIGMTLVELKPLKFVFGSANNHLRMNSEKYNLDKIYIGRYTEEFIYSNPVILDHQAKEEVLQLRINSQRKAMEGNNDELVEQIELAKKMGGTESTWSKFLSTKKNNNEVGE